MYLYALRIILLLSIASLYAIYDVYNKRNVPEVFVYSCFAIGIALTLTLAPSVAVLSILIAVAILAIGYLLYKAGQLGLGDSFEFATISLILPIQQSALLSSNNQFGMPFIVSVFIATGIATLISVPIYYLLFAGNASGYKDSKINAASIIKGLALLLAYITLFFFITFFFGFRVVSLVLILVLAIPSAILGIYEQRINLRMINFVYPSMLDEGDIIATNLMSDSDINYFKRISSNFGKLATKNLIAKIKNSRKKLPVYKAAVPLALFILIGTIISILFGDVLLFLL
ncbi:MAG: prepilin peptidase [Candidatus Micrarchaeia archaeon]